MVKYNAFTIFTDRKEFYGCNKQKNLIDFLAFSGKSAEKFSRCLFFAAFVSNVAEI
jgi:hypothetical protein